MKKTTMNAKFKIIISMAVFGDHRIVGHFLFLSTHEYSNSIGDLFSELLSFL
jgi:hypothetical protein